MHEAAQIISQRLELDKKPRAQTAIVLGSGLGPFAEKIQMSPQCTTVSFGEIPHFSSATVEGHKGEVVYSMIDNELPILMLNGRLHFYEGLMPYEVVVPIRVFGLLGIKTLILTNAAGPMVMVMIPAI